MSVRNVATKTNLMNLSRELEFARLGYELLDQKRNILVLELLAMVDQAADYEKQVQKALVTAFSSFEQSVLNGGKLQLMNVTGAVDIDSSITLRQRKVMGVRLPVVETEFHENPPYFSPAGTSFWVDDSIEGFKNALKLMGRLAELKVSIFRLAREVKRTIRKVNALERIAIPELDIAVKQIRDRLEENEREMFTLMKLVKTRLEQKEGL
ncbi:MAG: V-type ATP synthase subunit D [Spirochaetaceae bacterium]|nr:V-type ATP synthase subunit D [Spirochaetaceae bacterium]